MSQLAQSIYVTNPETLLDIFQQNGFYQALNIRTFIAKGLHLWKTSIVYVIHKSTLTLGFSLSGNALGINLMVVTILREREWIKVNLVVATCKMRGQFAAK